MDSSKIWLIKASFTKRFRSEVMLMLEDITRGFSDATLALTVAYNGAPFCGFARQPEQCTVQGELERALQLLFKREVETTCAGRTDAGVHARGQVVSFDIARDELRDRTLHSLKRSLNALTHDDVIVREVTERPFGFSARFDAVSREYRYFIAQGDTPPLFLRDFSWHISRPLDMDAMAEGAAHLIGEHDFKSFCMAASAIDKPTCRFVESIDFIHEDIMGEECVVMRIVGNAFLHSMVRTIMGTLAMVGKEMRDPAWVNEVLAACDRRAAGENAPAQGLVFWQVSY